MKPAGLPAGPDEDLLAEVEKGAAWRHRVWESSNSAVVLGRATDGEREVHLDACISDGVPVLRRLGGGGAVVLGPGCLVVSLAATVGRELDVGGYLRTTSGFLAESLGRITGLPLGTAGTGDVCLGDRKLVGSSLFRRRRLLFYQAILLHSLDLSLVDRYLAHPLREPEYRRGRAHREFLATLAAAGVRMTARSLCEGLQAELSPLRERLE